MLLTLWPWSGQPGWDVRHRLALTAGAHFTYAWNGFVTIPLSEGIGVAGQIAIDALALTLVIAVAIGPARTGPYTTSGAPM